MTVPGLERGAANALEGLVKVARAAWANEALRSLIVAQARGRGGGGGRWLGWVGL